MFNLMTVCCAPGVISSLEDGVDATGTTTASAVPDPETMALTS